MDSNNNVFLSEEELDTIGEIMNISMGAAATAVSNMLDKQVMITTPTIEQQQFKDIDSSDLEPAIIVKIKYVQGIEGVNVIMLRRQDMQIILSLLMGNDFVDDSEEFVFDELSMSAACEVMNQMMGASATVLSEILGMPINISTPEAKEVNTKSEINLTFHDIEGDENVVAISFQMMIDEILDTNFSCFLTSTLTSRMVALASGEIDAIAETPVVVPEPVAPEPQAPVFEATPIPQAPMPETAPMPQAPIPETAPMPQASMPETPPMPQAPMPEMPPMPQVPMPGMPYPPYPPEGYYQGYPPPYGYPPQAWQQPPQQPPQPRPNVVVPPQNIKNAEFPDFSKQGGIAVNPSHSNLDLLMGVQLEVSVIIGRTKRKIRDIMEFGQGTVVELDKQTGSPAEVVVNGQLLAYGEVIVVGDNFGVRITEIVGTKDLMDLLNPNS